VAHAPAADAEVFLDFEGFIVYTPAMPASATTCPSTAEDVAAAADPLPELEYNKIKTSSYYVSHKFNLRNVTRLTELSVTAGHIFPLARVVASFFASLDARLYQALSVVHSELAKGAASVFFGPIAANPKAAASFGKQPPAVQAKMLINLGENSFTGFVNATFVASFSELGGSTKDSSLLDTLLKRLVMKYCQGQALEQATLTQDCAALKQDELLLQLLDHCLSSVDADA
jgi:hypothetical protein